MLRTWLAIQKRCPLAVGIPRAVRAAAMAYGAVIPLARISAMTGASAAARANSLNETRSFDPKALVQLIFEVAVSSSGHRQLTHCSLSRSGTAIQIRCFHFPSASTFTP